MQTPDGLLAEAELGEEARAFLEGNLYRFMSGAAEQDAQAAMEELSEISPNNPVLIRELQNRVWRARQFESWLKELVANGNNAVALYVAKTRE